MDQDLLPIRNLLYEILLAGDDTGEADIKATQQMAVNLSKKVKEGGVSIFQLQSVVNKQVIQKVTEALRLMDTYTQAALPEPDDVQDAEVTEPNEIMDLIYSCLDKKMSLVAFCNHMAERYCAEAIASMGEVEARKTLKIRKKKMLELTTGE